MIMQGSEISRVARGGSSVNNFGVDENSTLPKTTNITIDDRGRGMELRGNS